MNKFLKMSKNIIQDKVSSNGSNKTGNSRNRVDPVSYESDS